MELDSDTFHLLASREALKVTITWSWLRQGTSYELCAVVNERRDDALELLMLVDDLGRGETVSRAARPWLTPSKANLGGVRWWWECPECLRRCKALYLRVDYLVPLCRKCHGLAYRSAQHNKREFETVNRLLGGGAEVMVAFKREQARGERFRASCERRREYLRQKYSLTQGKQAKKPCLPGVSLDCVPD